LLYLIQKVQPLIKALDQAGFYMTKEIISKVLQETGEI